MFFKRIYTEGIAHYSYLFGSEGEAFVIDPRLDYGIYLEIAERENLRITRIFETHRNEDILLGSTGLARECGAQVFISAYEELDYRYGSSIREEDCFTLPVALTLTPLHTPGHTLGHLSYVLALDGKPYMVFTGDCLFYGGVGRTDFYGEANLIAMTAKLHDSIYRKLAGLGSEVLVMPAHGAGSVCGRNLDDIPYSTLGFELKHNKALRKDKDTFLKLNAKMHYKNPMFSVMEQSNPRGGGERLFAGLSVLAEIPARTRVIDLRERQAFLGAHIPGSLNLPLDMLASYAGWVLDEKTPLVLMADGLTQDELLLAQRILRCTGFKNLRGVLGSRTLFNRETAGLPHASLVQISPADYLELVKFKPEDAVSLDLRRADELNAKEPSFNVLHIPLQELRERAAEVPADKAVYILCGTGDRTVIGASYLAAVRGLDTVSVSGGMAGIEAAKEKGR